MIRVVPLWPVVVQLRGRYGVCTCMQAMMAVFNRHTFGLTGQEHWHDAD